MRRALLCWSMSWLSACSVFFDPGKVAAPVTCTDPGGPADLGALAGEAPGRLTWSWSTRGTGTYRLCTSVPGGSVSCDDVACGGGECSKVQDGLLDNVRLSATVSAVGCDGGLIGAAMSGASAIDTTQSDAGWVLDAVNCTRAEAIANGGDISLEMQGASCVAAFVTGDEGWGDLTLDAEVRHSPSLPGLIAGVGIAQNGAGNRVGFVTQTDGLLVYFPSNITKRSGGDTPVAEGVDVALTDWQQVRIIRRGATYSWSQSPLGTPLTERLRWFDPSPQTGRFGLGAAGVGRFELRRLRVSSRPLPFPASEDRVEYYPGEDGGLTRARRAGFAPTTAPCPALSACAASACAPPPGASCVQITTGFGSTQLGFQAPRGLDPTRDTEVTVRFGLPMSAAVGNNDVLSVRSTPIIISSRMQTTFGGANVAGGLADNSWHLATVRFPADGGVITGTLDGMPVTGMTRWPLSDGNRGLDSLRLGGGSNVPLLFHELSVRQP